MKIRKTLGDKNQVGAKVTALRRAKGMKQVELLAQMQTKGVDINPTSLSKLEGQNRKASYEELRALAEVFGVTIEDLFTQSS